jgi:aldehyde:ferredoxin oxidoreductase
MENIFGKILKIDLTTRTTETIRLEEDLYLKYLGGRGLGSYILYHWLQKGTKPLDPANWILFLVGPVTGTLVPTAIKYVVITKSPLTGAWLDSYSSGRIAWEIKKAGWDGLAITGRASEPIYLWIEDNRIEFRDASKLWGKGSFETESYMLKETKNVGTLVVGPAAENGVKFAGIRSDFYRCAGRGGAGTVLASKNVKAIAIKGTNDIQCHNMEALLNMRRQFIERAKNSHPTQALKAYGTGMAMSITNEAGMLPTKNFQFGEFEQALGSIDGEAVLTHKARTKGCHSCIMPCGHLTRNKAGDLIKSPEYETLALLGSNIGIADFSFVATANHLCDDLGMDTISTGGVISFAMECFERGILTKTDTHGLDLTFGNRDAALQLIEDIAYRRGLGQILSEGVREAARQIGGEAFHYAMHVKGMELPGYDPRGAFGSYLSYSVNPRGGCHRRAWPPKFEILGNVPPYEWKGKASLIKDMFDERIILHSLLVCDFPANFLNITLEEYVSMLNDVTGGGFTLEAMRGLADRVETQIRLFNCREGLTREDDTLPLRFYSEPFQKGAPKGRVLERHDFERMLEEYYALRGWNKDGSPKKETLANLGITP